MSATDKNVEGVQFFGWDRPILPAAAGALAERFGSSPGLNLSQVTVVVPGQRAGRALLAVLAKIAEQRGTVLLPPVIATPGRLPELLYRTTQPEISTLESELLLVSLLRSDPTRLAPLFPAAAATDRFGIWHGLATQLLKLRSELGATGRGVPEILTEFIENYDSGSERWEVLRDLNLEFEAELATLELTEKHLSRPEALAGKELIALDRCVLIGTLDLPPVVKRFLLESGSKFESWVQAPADFAAGFDRFGSVVPSFWLKRPLLVPEEKIAYGRSPVNQAEECARIIGTWAGAASADDIAVAVPDDAIIPHIEEVLGDYQLPVRAAGGVSRSKVGPVFVLNLLSAFLSKRKLQDLGSLLRHPDLFVWLAGNEGTKPMANQDLLLALDKYQQHALPLRLLPNPPGTIGERQKVAAVEAAVLGLCGPDVEKELPLSLWGEPIRRMLIELYGARRLRRGLDAEKMLLETLELLDEELRAFETVLEPLAPVLSLGEAIKLLVQRVESERAEPNTFEAAIELAGWLELYLDERPFVVVTGFNEGVIPESANEDSFLPNAVRSALGITDNGIRYARDAAILSSLLHNRKDTALIVGGIGALGEFLPPSRLLLSDPQTISQRVRRFYGAFDHSPAPARETGDTGTSKLLPIKPEGLIGAVKKVRVTALSKYLECPYRFYLRYVEKLDEMRDDLRELSPLEFGNLGHDILKRFADDPLNSALTGADSIYEILVKFLDETAAVRFGRLPLPTVTLQLEQLRLRFRNFSAWQAGWAAAGWRIQLAERDFEGILDTANGELGITARIDRLDRNERTGEFAVFDYKFGDDSAALFRRSTADKSLQLPLYRMLLSQSAAAENPKLGIIPMTGDEIDPAKVILEMSAEALSAAEEEARRAAEGILAGIFWPPSKLPAREIYSGICGTGAESDDEDAGEGSAMTNG